MISLADLERTEVIVPGSLASYDYRFALPPGMDAAALLADLRRGHPDARWRARGTRDVQPQVTRFTDRLASYLAMAALTTLLIGGVGVALAIQNYLAGKTATIATLKCLGARSRLIFATYLLQVLVLAGIGVLAGLTVGQFVPWLLTAVFGPLLPIRVILDVYPLPLLVAAACGLLTALVFAIWPLARAREVSPAAMFRALVVPPERLPPSRRAGRARSQPRCAGRTCRVRRRTPAARADLRRRGALRGRPARRPRLRRAARRALDRAAGQRPRAHRACQPAPSGRRRAWGDRGARRRADGADHGRPARTQSCRRARAAPAGPCPRRVLRRRPARPARPVPAGGQRRRGRARAPDHARDPRPGGAYPGRAGRSDRASTIGPCAAIAA